VCALPANHRLAKKEADNPGRFGRPSHGGFAIKASDTARPFRSL
jgi:hypothetical protein